MILVLRFLVPKGYMGLTLFPFIILKDKGLLRDKTLVNHERIHLKQQLELLIIPFFVWYGIEFLIRLMYYKSWHLAYRNISFEREAYANEDRMHYIRTRAIFNFRLYL